MKAKNLSKEIGFFNDLIEEAYFRKAWHGPNLHSALKGINADNVLKRPSKGRHNIYEITVHSAYWVYRVMQRIKKNPDTKFPLKGTNWFESPLTLSDSEWRKVKNLLNGLHKELNNLLLNLNKELKSKHEVEKQKISRLIIGIAMHDVYHAGQIQLVKKLIS